MTPVARPGKAARPTPGRRIETAIEKRLKND